jgi:hypothetical protein
VADTSVASPVDPTTYALLTAAVQDTRNRGQLHIFLGDPLSDMVDKTVVEPGGNFSPGLWTCGVSIWIQDDNGCHNADTTKSTKISSQFGSDGRPPTVVSSWAASDRVVTNELATLSSEGAEGCDFLQIALSSGKSRTRIFLVVRSEGPAGASLTELREESTRALVTNDGTRITAESATAAASITRTSSGELVGMILLGSAEAGNPWSGAVKVEHAFASHPGGDLLSLTRPYENYSVDVGLAVARERWDRAIPARVFAPDPRVSLSWEAHAHHLLTNAENGIPRIAVVDYPVLWMRDSTIQVRALDNLGRADLARRACDHLAPTVFSGGFGAEADAPGQGIWALVSHAESTGDLRWLRSIYPDIVRRVEWLDRMRTTTTTLRSPSMNRMPKYLSSPAINLVCLPSDDGLIVGRMDWQYPGFYINAWAVRGYRSAARAAALLGEATQEALWTQTANDLDSRVTTRLLPLFGNERDSVVTPYPTGAALGEGSTLKDRFAHWFEKNRLDQGGQRVPELLWTYFEAAQAHNALDLGLTEQAWVTIGPLLDGPGPWALHAFGEGEPAGNESAPFGGLGMARGWLDPSSAANGNMPHGWTSAEMVNLIRAIFVRDDEDTLVLGAGVPSSWWGPGATFGVTGLPTRWGPLTFTAVAKSDHKWFYTVDTKAPWVAVTESPDPKPEVTAH